MRSHTLVAVFAAAGTIADANIQAAPQRRQQAEPGVARWAAPELSTRSTSTFHTSSARRAELQIMRRSSLKRRPRRRQFSERDDSEDSDDDDDDDDSDDEDDEHEKNEEPQKSNAGAIAGGVIGGIVLIVLLFFLLFWFKLRPRRLRRRRKRQEEEEEEKKRRQRQDEETATEHSTVSYPQQQQPYQTMPVVGPEPVHARGGVSPPVGGTTPTPNGGRPASPPIPPQGTTASPAELASPVVADGREPPPAPLDHGKLSSSPPPRYSTAFPTMTELSSPVDGIPVANGREPSSLPSALEPDYGTKASYARTYVEPSRPAFHPADQPNPDY
ncbi:hypothetical protein F5B22DRAFT_359110 [Xylaria bambusicola]|uniref:uncharacterized protein n=1 Tax=Xylaria bambusicola TaxID=326684 RepID=UPI002007DBE5|nr:uncharacterized protein F5B22DRAFT_359110 [Xylaria bambusicola]KAI0509286.1 hypothetical protein F5B22DRAFT_359110 [Xylaria bambusicola]